MVITMMQESCYIQEAGSLSNSHVPQLAPRSMSAHNLAYAQSSLRPP